MTNHFIKFFFYVLSVLAMAAMSSCYEWPTITFPSDDGMLTGMVQAWDDKTNTLSDASGITVTISGFPSRSTTTDAAGRYSFNYLLFLVKPYDLTLSKPGYGTLKINGVHHHYNASQGFTVVPSINFGQLSTTSVTALSVAGNMYNGQPGVSFNYVLSPVPTTASKAFVRYFLGTNAAVSDTNYTAYDSLRNFSNLSNVTGFSRSDLLRLGFTTGQTVYIRMYGDSFISNDYVDTTTNKRVFPNINPNAAPAVSITVP